MSLILELYERKSCRGSSHTAVYIFCGEQIGEEDRGRGGSGSPAAARARAERETRGLASGHRRSKLQQRSQSVLMTYILARREERKRERAEEAERNPRKRAKRRLSCCRIELVVRSNLLQQCLLQEFDQLQGYSNAPSPAQHRPTALAAARLKFPLRARPTSRAKRCTLSSFSRPSLRSLSTSPIRARNGSKKQRNSRLRLPSSKPSSRGCSSGVGVS